MSMSAQKRRDEPPLDTESLMGANSAMGGNEGRFKARREQKFNHKENKAWFITMLCFETAIQIFDLYMIGSAAAAISAQNASPDYVSYFAWMIFVAIMTGLQLAWLVLSSVIAGLNCAAVSRGDKELPTPELRISLWWHMVLFFSWAVVLGFIANLYANRVVPSNSAQERAFETYMWLVVLVGTVYCLDFVRYIGRWILDAMLICCDSKCYDF